MPIYEYRCRECGTVFSIFLRSSDSTGVECPACGSKDMEKLISTSYVLRTGARAPGTTCCGRTERCDSPPCTTNDTCRRE